MGGYLTWNSSSTGTLKDTLQTPLLLETKTLLPMDGPGASVTGTGMVPEAMNVEEAPLIALWGSSSPLTPSPKTPPCQRPSPRVKRSMHEIYVVQGLRGSPHDATTYLICAYRDRAEAERHVAQAIEKASALGIHYSSERFSRYSLQELKEVMGDLDPYIESWSPVDYEIESLDLK